MIKKKGQNVLNMIYEYKDSLQKEYEGIFIYSKTKIDFFESFEKYLVQKI